MKMNSLIWKPTEAVIKERDAIAKEDFQREISLNLTEVAGLKQIKMLRRKNPIPPRELKKNNCPRMKLLQPLQAYQNRFFWNQIQRVVLH